jgi:hypothetical protein
MHSRKKRRIERHEQIHRVRRPVVAVCARDGKA